MSRIVQTIAILLYPFCLVFGIYVVLHGHITPGGGFQGGAVMATGAALMIVAGLYRRQTDPAAEEGRGFKTCEVIGLCTFVLVALGGIFRRQGAFMLNWLLGGCLFGKTMAWGSNPGDLQSSGIIALLNLAVGIEVLGGITIILLTMIRAMRAANADWSSEPAICEDAPAAQSGEAQDA